MHDEAFLAGVSAARRGYSIEVPGFFHNYRTSFEDGYLSIDRGHSVVHSSGGTNSIRFVGSFHDCCEYVKARPVSSGNQYIKSH